MLNELGPVLGWSFAVLGGTALASALLLAWVGKRFAVQEDPRIEDVAQLLPGINCGNCGFPGCRGLSEAFVKAAASGSLGDLYCPPGGSETAQAVAGYFGLTPAAKEPTTAVLLCGGTCEKAPSKNTYDGPRRCHLAHPVSAGEHGCAFGCLRFGDCAVACEFDALRMDPLTGLPVVDEAKCVSCGACVRACPRGLFKILPQGPRGRVTVLCRNTEKGAVAMKNCKAACIGCSKCAKVCPVNAITVENELAVINPALCTACEACVGVCPTKAIVSLIREAQA